MVDRRWFKSDNNAGTHPQILAAISAINKGHVTGYGGDQVTNDAKAKIEQLFHKPCDVFFVGTGGAANILGVSQGIKRFSSVIVSDEAHILKDEARGLERFSGVGLLAAKSVHAKLSVKSLAEHHQDIRSVHAAQPQVVSITQSTERGTVYSLAELRAITAWAHERNLFVHMDGARFANAVVGLDCTPQEAVEGIDVLSFGMTKNGAMGVDAVVFFNRELAKDFAYSQKQMGHLFSKMRFLAVQCSAMLEGNLWLANAKNANDMAAYLACGLEDRGYEITVPVETNQVFVKLPANILEDKGNKEFYIWNESIGEARLVTSFDTTKDDVDQFLGSLR